MTDRALGNVLRLALDDETVQLDRDYPIAGVYGFGRGLFRRGPIHGDETSYQKLNRLTSGRLVMSRLKAFEGALTVVPPEFDGWYLSPEFPTFEIDATQADERYLANLCAWPGFWSRLSAQSKGVGARKERVSADRLLAVKVPLPELNEQRHIAARLDSMFVKHARINELRSRRVNLTGAFAESVIGDGIRLASESFPIRKIMALKRRQVFPEPGKTYREIGIKSFGRGLFHKEPVTGEQIGDKRVFAIESGDLLFSNVFAREGAVALAGDAESGLIGSHRFMTYVVNGTMANAAYLMHYFTSSLGLDTIRRASPGSAGRNRTLGIKTFEEQWIPLPSLETQQRIGRFLDAASTRLQPDAEFINALRLSLLNAAFSGKL